MFRLPIERTPDGDFRLTLSGDERELLRGDGRGEEQKNGGEEATAPKPPECGAVGEDGNKARHAEPDEQPRQRPGPEPPDHEGIGGDLTEAAG
ncbi:MAG: hypothetical protein ACRDNH_00755, partial [Gaiellaceae bacterium]